MRRSPTNGATPGKGETGARWIGEPRDKEAPETISLQERDGYMTEKPQPGFVSEQGESVSVRKRQPVESLRSRLRSDRRSFASE
jgi:hypothetical protein